jgi:hypothetical protein
VRAARSRPLDPGLACTVITGSALTRVTTVPVRAWVGWMVMMMMVVMMMQQQLLPQRGTI